MGEALPFLAGILTGILARPIPEMLLYWLDGLARKSDSGAFPESCSKSPRRMALKGR